MANNSKVLFMDVSTKGNSKNSKATKEQEQVKKRYTNKDNSTSLAPKTTTTKDDESWIKKVARYIDENTSNDADATFGYDSLAKGKQTLTETVDKAKAKNEQTRKENTAAAAELRKEQKADAGGTTFGEDRKKTDGKNMKWWEKLNAEAANAADATYGTYSPGNATGRTKVGNTVASGLQDAGSSVAEATGFVTDQKGDKEPTLAEITYGDDKVQVLPFMKKFWQKISDAAYKQSDKMAEEAEKSKTIAKDGAGTVGSFLVDAGSAATQMGADIAVSGVTGINGLIPMAVRSFGGGLREARQDGASKQEQFNYAVGSAAMEVLTEKLGSVALPFNSTYGKGAVDNLVENLIKESAKTKMGAAALSTLFSAMSEGGEEILSDVVNPILKTIAYDPEAYKEYGTAEYWSNLLRDGLLGAGLGLAGGGGQIVSAARNTVANRGNGNVETSFDPNSANWQGEWFDETSNFHNSTAHLNRELLKVGIDAFGVYDGMTPLNSRAFGKLEDVYRSRTISAESIAKAVAQAYAGEISKNLSDVVIKAYEIEGKPMPDYIRSEYAPTVDDEIKSEKENASYQKGQADYFKALAKQAERKDNKELAKKYSEQEKECRDRAKQSQKAIKELEAQQTAQPLTPVDAVVQTAQGVNEQAAQPTAQPTMNDVVGAMTGKPMDAATISNAETVQQADPFAETVKDESHIDNRKYGDMGDRKVKPFQMEHPELHQYYKDMAMEVLLNVGSAVATKTKNGYLETRFTDGFKRALGGKTFNDGLMALQAIYDDHGQEDYALAKRMEIYLDELLTSGYFTHNGFVEPNADYIAAKQSIEGGRSEWEQFLEENSLAIIDGTTTEEEVRQDFLAMKAAQSNAAEMMDNEDLRYSSVGAATAGFEGEMTPGQKWVAEAQGIGDSALHSVSKEQSDNLAKRQHRAEQEIPLLDPNGRLTRKGVASIANSGVTNQEMSDILREEAFGGAFSYDANTDKRAVSRANKAIEGRYWQALDEFLSDTANGKVSKDNTVKGIVLYNNAVQNGDYATALDIAIALANDGTNSAQALQARRLLAKLSPSGKLYSVVKSTEKIAKEQAKKVGTKKLDKEADKIETAANEAMDEAAEEFAKKSSNPSSKSKGGNEQGNTERKFNGNPNWFDAEPIEPFWFEYEEKVGEAVGKSVANRVKNRNPKTRKFMETIISNLTSFANQLTPTAVAKPKMTSTERIADYLANKEFYDNAWEKAQEYLITKYGKNKDMLNALSEFMGSMPTMTTPLGTQTMLKALAESAMATYESNKTLATQNALNINGAAQTIADNLISEVERISGLPLDEETKYTIGRAAEDYVSNAVADTNPEQLAQSQIRDVMATIGETVAEVAKKSDTNKTAVAMAVTDMLTTRWGLSAEDATNIAEVVQEQYTDMVKQAMETKLKQMYGEKKSTQIRSMTDLFVESVNLGAFDSEEYSAKAAEKFFGVDITVDPDLAQDYVEALEDGDEQSIDEAYKALVQSIARQVPSTWRDKFNAWRYFAMLANPTTHIRNTFGNAGFAPVREIKNVLAVGGEVIADKVSGGKIDRTKAILTPSANDRALIATAVADYAESKDAILSGGKYDDGKIKDSFASDINENRTIYPTKVLETPRKLVSKALDDEDSWFSKPAYAVALARYLKANGITAKQWADGAISAEDMAKARAVAVKEAQKATYRDTNAFSEMVSKWRVKPAEADASTAKKVLRGGANVLVEGLMPFKKTPANILARAVEYSPIGLAHSLTGGIHDVRTGKITAAEYIDGLASGLTGTGIIALGAFLASQGVLSGGGDDNDELDKLQGIQNYSLNVGDRSISLSWLAPEAMPLFVGVEIWNNMLDNDNENASIWSLMQSLLSLSEPITEMSMLSGVQGMIESIRYSDNVLTGVGVQLATSYISQFLPTMFGKIEAITEDARQTTFIDKNSEVPADIQKFVGKILNKFFGEYQQMDYIDDWGRTQESGSLAERMFNNLVNPAYVNDIKVEDVENELRKLVDAGYTEVMPKRATSSTQIEGEYMTQEQFETYAKAKGQTSLETVNRLVNSTAYRNMNDADKAAAIKSAYDYAEGIAKLKVKPNAEVESWITEAKNSNNPAQYIVDKAAMKYDADGSGGSTTAEQIQGLINAGYSGKELRDKITTYITDKEDGELLKLFDKAQSAKVPDKTIAEVYDYYKNAHNIENGATRQEQVFDYINGLNLSVSQKQALYYSLYKKLP